MEQQNQQPVQEKIENKPPAKTNWKLFAAIAIAAAVLSIGGILLLKAIQFSSSPAPLPGNNLQTLEGRLISESLEGGCWHLRAAPSGSDPVEGIKTFELLGISEEDLKRYEHQWVQVKGRIREDMASVCQLGPIFEVQQISTTEKNNQQSTVDTSTWQTYRNAEYGFEMQIPKEWVPLESKGRGKNILSLTLNVIPDQPFGDSLLYALSAESMDRQEDITAWFQREAEFSEASMKDMFDIANEIYGESFLSMADFSINIDSTKVDGLPAKVQTIRCLKDDCYFLGGPQHRKEYYMKHDDVVFTIKVITLNPEAHFGLLDQILATFRFAPTTN